MGANCYKCHPELALRDIERMERNCERLVLEHELEAKQNGKTENEIVLSQVRELIHELRTGLGLLKGKLA